MSRSKNSNMGSRERKTRAIIFNSTGIKIKGYMEPEKLEFLSTEDIFKVIKGSNLQSVEWAAVNTESGPVKDKKSLKISFSNDSYIHFWPSRDEEGLSFVACALGRGRGPAARFIKERGRKNRLNGSHEHEDIIKSGIGVSQFTGINGSGLVLSFEGRDGRYNLQVSPHLNNSRGSNEIELILAAGFTNLKAMRDRAMRDRITTKIQQNQASMNKRK